MAVIWNDIADGGLKVDDIYSYSCVVAKVPWPHSGMETLPILGRKLMMSMTQWYGDKLVLTTLGYENAPIRERLVLTRG